MHQLKKALAFSRWGEIFGSPTLANAVLDRLLHHSQIISIKGTSYRLKEKRTFLDVQAKDWSVENVHFYFHFFIHFYIDIYTIRITDNYAAYEGLKSGGLDFALVKLRPEDRLENLKYISLIEETLLVIINRNNPIASHKAITAEDLTALPVLVGEKTTNLYTDFQRIYRDRNANFRIVLETSFDRDLIVEMISNDGGIQTIALTSRKPPNYCN